jgi:hypothetical protein
MPNYVIKYSESSELPRPVLSFGADKAISRPNQDTIHADASSTQPVT